jgi:uncharacterized OB-fold protein
MTEVPLEMNRCGSCHVGFLPRPGRCPRCGSSEIGPLEISPRGIVRAATELLTPATGWSAPHRLALVEVAEGIRLLAIVTGPLPALGSSVTVTLDGSAYRAAGPDGPRP